jgi:chromosome segregation protein
MRLGNLTISGFKSFGERTIIEFSPSVTAIIGPNGSGKSNVIDALRWVTGGGRARSYRADSRTELIFHGAAGKRSVSFADVELELQTDGSPIRIQRNLFRDGNGSLKLNGTAARLMDVEEALVGTGLGRGSVAVIGQGEVGEILIAGPDRLLEYAAEAAGVAQLGRRREITISRLGTARSHLSRLDDVLSEMGEQVEALEAEAGEAEQHEELSREALRLGFTRAYQRVLGLQGEISKLHTDERSLGGEITTRRDRLRVLGAELVGRKKIQGESEVLYRTAVAEGEARRGDLRVAEERLRAEQQKVEGIRTRKAEAEEQQSALSFDEPILPKGDPGALLNSVTITEEAVKTAERQQSKALDHQAKAAAEHEELRQAFGNFFQRQDAFEVRRDTLEKQRSELQRRRAAILEEKEPPRAMPDLNHAQKRLEQARSSLREIEVRIASARAILIEAQTEAGALEKELARLQQGARERRGYADGPKIALTSGLPGVIGSVADILQVPTRYRAALAAALGNRAEHVVVEATDEGLAILEFVQERGCRVTVLPLDKVPTTDPVNSSLVGDPSAGRLMRDVVTTDKRFGSLVESLFPSTVIVGDLDEAFALSKEQPTFQLIVTLRGEWLASNGAFSGGHCEDNASYVGQHNEEDEVGQQLKKAHTRARDATEILDGLEGDNAKLQEEERTVTDALGKLLAQVAAHEEALRARQRETQQIEELESLNQEALKRLTVPLEPQTTKTLETVNERVGQTNENVADALASLMGAREDLARIKTEHGLYSERLLAYQVLKARFEKDRERCAEVLSSIGQLEALLIEAGLSQELCATEVDSAKIAIPDNLDQWDRNYLAAVNGVDQVEVEQEQLTQEQAESGSTLGNIQLTLARRETALELARDDLAAYPDGVLIVDLAHRDLRKRLAEVEQSLKNFGPVNHRARLDFVSRSERLRELDGERTEATAAVEELDIVLIRIDNETTTKLNQTLEELRKNFARHVITLFGSGAVSDLRVEREDGRPIGLELVLQPPGKQTKALNLLSVGERTMGALAFLFSLVAHSGKDGAMGLPVAVLDEVDAPLDEANIRRFCAFVGRLANDGTQFVLITHQKATFEVADAIWGVTSQEGVSRVFSIRRDEEVALRV